MTIEHNGPQSAYPDPAERVADTGEGHGPGLEQTASEPHQGVDEHGAEKRPVDWSPPPGNPGSDQDAQTQRRNGGADTDSQIDAQ
ncbi:hypothetical protein NRB16_28000 [Pseudomonas sp. LJDD11]|uniref:hypothetical protein n=1 Tax=Pseudomonas sp. LJDD11 TaxID=2931984 RepID=UPI00211C4C24|nr:hypothetical protein [Pseudomonas sp. LJDD11]MCQ9427361.1 hypothetical protein [Pseudomonas sp. LJDD11]